METLKARSVGEQVAAHLRRGIRQGRWKESMPGIEKCQTKDSASIRAFRATAGGIKNARSGVGEGVLGGLMFGCA